MEEEYIEHVEYTVVINGKPEGPYPLAALKTLNIQPGTFLRKPGMDDYKEAHEFEELRKLLGFTYQQTAPQYFASFDQRLLASAVDYFLLMLIYVFFVVILVIIKGKEVITGSLLVLPAIPVVKLIYGTIAEASTKQATIGKSLLNIKVTGLMGDSVSLTTSFVRNISKILSVLPLFFGYLYSFLNKKQQCWHDIAANTLVIKDRLL